MKFIIKLAFKNIFRNHRRTFLTTISITYAVILLIFGKSFMEGVYGPMRESILDLQTAHVRITAEGYLMKERLLPVNKLIDSDAFEKNIEHIKGIKTIRPRVKFGALIAKDEEEIEGMMILSIRPESEKDNRFILGTNLQKGDILVSKQFSEKYNIHINDSLVIIAPTRYGYLNGIKLKVSEFYECGINYIANKTAFIHIDDARFLLSMNKYQATELMIIANSGAESYRVYRDIEAVSDGNEDISFYESEGSLIQMIKIGIYFTYIFLIIIFALAFIAIINTMIMALYERIKEVGMMKSLGLSNRKVFAMFLVETVIITLLGAALGVLLGSALTYYIQLNGIDFSAAMNDIEFPMESVWYTKLTLDTILFASGLSVISGLLSSLFLLRRIWKINPVDVLRE